MRLSKALGRILSVAVVVGAANVAVVAPASAEPNALGMNIDAPMDWLPQRIFADAVKSSRNMKGFVETANGKVDAAVDGRGWPKEDFEIGFWFDADRMNGTYRLSFTGRADVEVWERGTLKEMAFDSSSNTTTANLVISEKRKAPLVLRFTNTRRTRASKTSDGLTDVRLMRPLAEGSARSYRADTLLTSQFVRALAPFSVVRYNAFTASDYGEVVDWKDRAQPLPSLNQPMAKCAPEDNCWQGQGAPWEYVVLIANALHKDAWISIPTHVNDDYVRQLALLFRDGNAFTGRKGLDPTLHLYVEFGNEMWNWSYYHTKENSAAAKAEYAKGDPYHYGPNRPDFDPWSLRTGRRIADMSRIFRSVFGDPQMMTRIRPVLAWQSVSLETGLEPLIYLEERYIPACVAGTLPVIRGVSNCAAKTKVNDLLYGGGGSAYYYTAEEPKGVTLDNVWKSSSMDAGFWGTSHQIANSIIARTFGLKRVAYEGGPHFNLLCLQDEKGNRNTPEKPGCASDVARMAAWSDIRMKSAVLEHHAAWSHWDGDLLVYSAFVGGNEFGFLHDVLDADSANLDTTSPKMSALQVLARQERAPTTIGAPSPGTVAGNAFNLGSRAWYKPGRGTVHIPDGEWLSYLFNVPADGAYDVVAALAGGSPDNTLLQVDGGPVATSVNGASVSGSVSLAHGLHAIRVRAKGREITLGTVSLAPAPSKTPRRASP
jgi:hypothetical protein